MSMAGERVVSSSPFPKTVPQVNARCGGTAADHCEASCHDGARDIATLRVEQDKGERLLF